MLALTLGDTLDGIDVAVLWCYSIVDILLMLVVAL